LSGSAFDKGMGALQFYPSLVGVH